MSTLLKVMVCHLFSTKSSPNQCSLIVSWTFRNFDFEWSFIEIQASSFKKMWECHLQNVNNVFAHGTMCYRERGSGPHLEIKMHSYQYKDPNDKDKMALWPSYHYHGDPHTWRDIYYYWDGALGSQQFLCNHGYTSSQIYHVMLHDWQALGAVIIPISFLYITGSYYVSPD